MKSICLFAVALSVVSCRKAPPEPQSMNKTSATTTTTSPLTGTSAAKPMATAPKMPRPMMDEAPGKDDPRHGVFSLDDALAGLPGTGTSLVADIDTALGKLTCDLYADKAPKTVANFVGLARGIRDWKTPDGVWVKQPAYDGTTFHRVIKGFMIQGGDPSGTGAGQPGYVIDDEFWPGTTHDQRGLLCMANRGPNTNGAQFFILDAPAPHLTARHTYTNFGKCGPDAVIEKLSSVPVQGDHSTSPTAIKKITIRRK